MNQFDQGRRERDRVHVRALVDRAMRDHVLELARARDRSVSSILRRALQAELDRAAKGNE